jgi:hypothetical protein
MRPYNKLGSSLGKIAVDDITSSVADKVDVFNFGLGC